MSIYVKYSCPTFWSVILSNFHLLVSSAVTSPTVCGNNIKKLTKKMTAASFIPQCEKSGEIPGNSPRKKAKYLTI
jgi:hypothetical protein